MVLSTSNLGVVGSIPALRLLFALFVDTSSPIRPSLTEVTKPLHWAATDRIDNVPLSHPRTTGILPHD
jgi:hypothetical protein